MKSFWNERFSAKEYIYGETPNLYFKSQIEKLRPGKILLPAEGEGRNAVYAASLGWEVTSFDQSEEGQRKALALAAKNKVTITYQVGEVSELEFEENSFDAIALIFAHFPAEVRTTYHRRFSRYLKPGGHIILEAFSKSHGEFQRINPRAGGPQDIGMRYTTEEIAGDFPGFDIIELKEEITELAEGSFHSGKVSVIRFAARKK